MGAFFSLADISCLTLVNRRSVDCSYSVKGTSIRDGGGGGVGTVPPPPKKKYKFANVKIGAKNWAKFRQNSDIIWATFCFYLLKSQNLLSGILGACMQPYGDTGIN